jgi:hypothetical protein
MDGQNENMQVDLSEALAQDGQLIITQEDGNGLFICLLFIKNVIISLNLQIYLQYSLLVSVE